MFNIIYILSNMFIKKIILHNRFVFVIFLLILMKWRHFYGRKVYVRYVLLRISITSSSFLAYQS